MNMSNTNLQDAQHNLAHIADELVRWQPIMTRSPAARVNTRLAMATNDIAAKTLADLATDEEAQQALQQQLAVTAPHVASLKPSDWQELLGEPDDKKCEKYDDTCGGVAYLCSLYYSDEKTYPCMTCPFLTNALSTWKPDPVQYPAAKPTDPRPAHTTPQDSELPIDIIRSLFEAAQLAFDEPWQERHPMAYAAIALANTAYYVTAAVEHLEGHRDAEASPSDDLMLLIQKTMGDTDERPIRPKYEKTTYCTRIIEFTTGRTQYICEPPDGQVPPEATNFTGLMPKPCANCHYHQSKHRPHVTDLIEATDQSQ